jgi:hypothetical protein
MAYDESRSDLGPGQLLLLFAMGEAIRRGDRFLNFMQNFAYYKYRWGAVLIPVVNVQLLRRASLHNLRAAVGEWSKRLVARRAETAKRGQMPGTTEASGHTETARPAETAEAGNSAAAGGDASRDLTRARELTVAALAYDGVGIRRLDRQQASVYLPFEIE